jgi:hypothetical protein
LGFRVSASGVSGLRPTLRMVNVNVGPWRPDVRMVKKAHAGSNSTHPSDCHPEAAGGAEPKAKTPEDAEGSEVTQAALEPLEKYVGSGWDRARGYAGSGWDCAS